MGTSSKRIFTKTMSQFNLQAQLKTAQDDTRPKFLIELAKPTQKKNCFKKISNASKKNKTPDTQARQKKHSTNDTNGRHKNGCNPRQARTPAYNIGLAIWRVKCFV